MSRRKIPQPESYAEVMRLFPNMRELADRMGIKYYTVTAWRTRNYIPPEYWERIATQAQHYGLTEVTIPLLLHLAERRAAREAKVRSRGSRPRDNDALASRPNRH